MQTANLIDDLTQRLASLMASGPARDLQHNARALLQSQLARLDLVSREEFEVQAALLQRCQTRLAALEARVSELEHAMASSTGVAER